VTLPRLDHRVTRAERGLHRVGSDLDARHGGFARAVAAAYRVPAHPRLPHAESENVGLERGDLREPLARHARAVREAAREARRRGLVPDRHAHRLREPADVFLAEARLHEGAPRAGFLRSVEPGAVVAEVVHVGAVDDVREPPLRLLRRADAVELALAVKAPVDVVSGVVLALDLVRGHELVARPEAPGDGDGALLLRRSEARAHGGHADAARTEHP